MAGVDDIIGQWVKQAERSGELRREKYWGKPFDLNDGFEQTPARLRQPGINSNDWRSPGRSPNSNRNSLWRSRASTEADHA